MLFTQYYLDCLSQASYLIGDETTGQAVIVDPRRDIDDYLRDAEAAGMTIVGVLNTHFHADFLSGHLEMAHATGAWIGYGEAAAPEFEHRSLTDGERISLGEVEIEIMTTPGHTPESISILVREHSGDVPYGVLTGDALFIGDVGRPDLLASVGVTADELGRMLHDSVQRKLMGLPDEVRVFPAHGAGSACGKNLSTERQSTIGEQRRTNYACQPMSVDEFLDVVTEGQTSAPAYFLYDAALNKQDREIRELDETIPPLDVDQVASALAAGAVVHDARESADFTRGHLRGSISVPIDGRMSETVGMLLRPQDRIVIVAPDGHEQEVAMRLARIGFDHAVGYVSDPESYLVDHPENAARASRLTVSEADAALAAGDVSLVDVRGPGETAGGTIPGAQTIPLPELRARMDEIDRSRPVVVYCAGGWRSSVAASVLRANGFDDVSDVIGGYNAWDRAAASR
ncbi:MAG TPA: rhodanese-like domain-containing protein [Phycicoccus sp.]|jgi:glyoxylase-like metal-dependent hydrolase (beta-lactamase superfamily II)/rhodanese-related sulfurtransferase|nr:rhodanese-like domain-containing protein [Phycicoccus sp.]HQH06431.1 rhodanese-like domain-containing protein [Phycicoccus sp.]HQK31599.1 rhodanese-like domain-containing protein [Phycicoccus sp.]HQY97579.1 rhodanese-like domain-containing protein [Phycicoccus sp.]HRA45001.1 rhodanese-like domain-containing protein [Phycicoccus sp.]